MATYANGQFSGHYGHWPPPVSHHGQGDIRQVIIDKDLGERDGQTYMNSFTIHGSNVFILGNWEKN